jgi:subtilisin family serine protease
MKKHMLILLLVLWSTSAAAAKVLCPRPTDCEREPLAVKNEYAVRLSTLEISRIEVLVPILNSEGITVLDEDPPERFLLLFADETNGILGAGKTLGQKKIALQALFDRERLPETVETLEPNHYVRGEGDCASASPTDDARNMIGLPSARVVDSAVVVAVLDSGTFVTHASFGQRLWTRNGEQPGNSDGDGNGIKGDYYGAAFENGNNHGDIASNSSHGTMVAGIVNARADKGPAGIAPYARVMTLKFLDRNNVGKTWDAARAIGYAANSGARIINMSWTTLCEDTRLQSAVSKASTHGTEGILLVAAAGNQGSGYDDNNDLCKVYPASYPVRTMIAVGATDPVGCHRIDSRYGRKTVHLAAPGSSIWTTDLNDACMTFSGTSAAAPVVAGTAALLAALTPSWNWQSRRQYLLDSVRAPPRPCQLTSVTGGIVSAAQATSAPVLIRQPASGAVVDPAKTPVDWDLAFDSTLCRKLDIHYAKDGTNYVPVQAGVPIKPSFRQVVLPGGATAQAKIRMTCTDTRLSAESASFTVR